MKTWPWQASYLKGFDTPRRKGFLGQLFRNRLPETETAQESETDGR